MAERYALVRLGEDGTIGGGAVVAEGSAEACLLAAAERLPATTIARIRLTELPRAHRAVGDREWREYVAAEAAGRN